MLERERRLTRGIAREQVEIFSQPLKIRNYQPVSGSTRDKKESERRGTRSPSHFSQSLEQAKK